MPARRLSAIAAHGRRAMMPAMFWIACRFALDPVNGKPSPLVVLDRNSFSRRAGTASRSERCPAKPGFPAPQLSARHLFAPARPPVPGLFFPATALKHFTHVDDSDDQLDAREGQA